VRLLLDTHVFLWLESEPERINVPTRAIVEDADNELYLSAVSAWEIVIKHALGKLHLPSDPVIYVPSRVARSGLGQLDVSTEHALAVGALPSHHDDPFDRLLIAQAEIEGMTLVTADERMLRYPIRTIRA
jgi:PIN domain nuclease of toxin-antitoxin system